MWQPKSVLYICVLFIMYIIYVTVTGTCYFYVQTVNIKVGCFDKAMVRIL